MKGISDLTVEQQLLRDSARLIARDKVAPRAREVDASGEFPSDIARVFSSAGFLSFVLPEKFGGADGDNVSICLCVEELARVCGSSALMVVGQAVGLYPVVLGGSDEVKSLCFRRVSEEGALAAFCLTEPEAGSDAASISTAARADGDHYILNGTKCFVTNGGVAGFYSVMAKTDPSAGSRGMSTFLVERDTPGVSVGKAEDKLGMRGSSTTELILEDARVPRGNLLGGEGQGFSIAMKTLDMSRPVVGALALGIAEGAFEVARDYAKERVQFGRPIIQHEAVGFMLADMATLIEASRGLVYRAADMFDSGDPGLSVIASMAKSFSSDAAMKVTGDAIQVLGGYGYTNEYPLGRMLRDAKVTQIFEGTNQIQRLVIARHL
jgi:alkylation response protein AidB-like acyl-CoA dehydrogenase